MISIKHNPKQKISYFCKFGVFFNCFEDRIKFSSSDNEYIEISSLISLVKFITFNSLIRSNNIFSIEMKKYYP